MNGIASVCPAVPGSIITFDYPRVNEIGVIARTRRRALLVEEIRDMSVRGVTPFAFVERPLKRRGRWLITGIDLDLGERRSFYWESMSQRRRDAWLQLAVYDPCDLESVEYLDGVFAPTRDDRLFLARVIGKYNEWAAHEPDIVSNLGIFPARQARDSQA